jgi:radical SAM superfamily enzyme YgiQ (UPF0313 family)
MKILLIYPYFLEERIHTEDVSVPPMGVYYVGAVLRENGYEVEILNWYDVHRTPEIISEVLTAVRPDVIGFSILHANRWGGIEIAGMAKQALPSTKIVFGGVGAGYLWEHLLTHFPQIDAVIVGEGESSFLKLLRHYENAEPPMDSIGGIAYRCDGRPVCNACAPLIRDLDELPNPARFFSYRHLSLTRGCPGECTFCSSPDFWGRRVRFHSAGYFVDQLELLHRRGIDHFFISDDTFTVNKKRAIDVCREIIRRRLPIQWQAISRVDMIDEEMLYWMRKAGCIQISYGVEHGSPKIRRLLNKNLKTEDIERAFALTPSYGMMSRAYFIYGCPGENRDTVRASIELMRRIKPLGAIFYLLDIFPGTALYEDFKRRHNLTDDVWLNRIEDILYFETDPHLSREQVMAFGRELRAAFYENLSSFVDAVQLVDKPDLFPQHADFLSRLAMTFDHGEYAAIDAVRGKSEIARKLYRQALGYHPDARAYLGLGILNQKEGRYETSLEILSEGLQHFPDHEHLNVCLAISHMNTGKYPKALSHLLPFQHSAQTLPLIVDCYRALGNSEMTEQYQKKIQAMETSV